MRSWPVLTADSPEMTSTDGDSHSQKITNGVHQRPAETPGANPGGIPGAPDTRLDDSRMRGEHSRRGAMTPTWPPLAEVRSVSVRDRESRRAEVVADGGRDGVGVVVGLVGVVAFGSCRGWWSGRCGPEAAGRTLASRGNLR